MYDKRIKHGLFFSILIAFCFLGMAATILPAQAEEQVEEVNTGQDFTKPLTRLDIRQKYQWLASDHFAAMTTFRVDKPFVLASKWVLGTRFDLPLMATDVVSGDNPDGDNQFGTSDFLAQLMMIAPQAGKSWTWAYGAQVIFPMASHDEMGSGRFQLAPLIGAKADLNFISRGSFCALLLRNHIDIGGSGSRADVNYLVIQPILNINLPKSFFLNLAPEMRVNWENDNRWFVPFDITIGKMLNKSTVVSIEYKIPVHDDNYPIYNAEVEARIGFFF